MLKGVSESARRHSQALGYIPDSGSLLAGGNMEYRLDSLIAEGGEGRVFAVKGRDDVVAKVYKEQDLGRKEKLRVMTDRGSRSLRKVCAWPLSSLCDSSEDTVGFVMESLVGWEPLHNAYQIRSRLKLFPYHTYAFLVRAARNLATCVHHLHEDAIVIGDLNESNVLVNGKAMVKLIDADSFQIIGPSGVFACKVGKTELMAPELQGHSLDNIVRTPEHDRFALAVLIFQTLVFGRHPFAGATEQHVDLPLETCIERGYYAYTTRRDIPVKPPPHLSLGWLPPRITALFEQAFDPNAPVRPTAKEWYFALKELEGSLKACGENPSHHHWGGIRPCPWCELEDRWRIALFRPALIDPDQDYEVGEILGKIAAIRVPTPKKKNSLAEFDYTTLQPAELTPLEKVFGRTSKNWGWFIFCSFQIVNAMTSFSGPRGYLVLFMMALMFFILLGIFFGRHGITVGRARKHLKGVADRWKQEADPDIYTAALQKYHDIAYDLRDVKAQYERGRQAYIEQIHASELNQYLAKYQIFIADAGPIGSEKLSYLDQHGIKTAADLTAENLRKLPRITPLQEQNNLLAWRRSLELQFWKSRNYKLTMHQERKLIVDIRKANDRRREVLEKAPAELEALSERLLDRQALLDAEAEKYVEVLRRYGPKLLALEGKK